MALDVTANVTGNKVDQAKNNKKGKMLMESLHT